MEIRYPANPEDFRDYTTDRIRRDYLIAPVFEEGKVRLVYSHIDRIALPLKRVDPFVFRAGDPCSAQRFFVESG